MQGKKVFRYIWLVVLLLAATLSCNLLTDIQEMIELKDTAEGIITDVGGIITEIPIEGIVTGVGAMSTQFEAIETEIGTIVTEMPDFTGEKPEDVPIMEGGMEMMASEGMIAYTIDKNYQEVVDYYEREMPINGWVKVEGSVEESYAQLVFEKADRKATIDITGIPFIDQTSVTIMVEGG